MHNKKDFHLDRVLQRCSASISYLLTGLIFVFVTSFAIADDYLDALQNEAKELQYLESNKSLSINVTIDEFEKLLKQKKPGAASIYRRLGTASRLRVFNAYKATQDFSKTEQLIHQLNLARDK